jgi:hypothetical protein
MSEGTRQCLIATSTGLASNLVLRDVCNNIFTRFNFQQGGRLVHVESQMCAAVPSLSTSLKTAEPLVTLASCLESDYFVLQLEGSIRHVASGLCLAIKDLQLVLRSDCSSGFQFVDPALMPAAAFTAASPSLRPPPQPVTTPPPSQEPTLEPTRKPSEVPTQQPTTRPTEAPTTKPTLMPTSLPTSLPTLAELPTQETPVTNENWEKYWKSYDATVSPSVQPIALHRPTPVPSVRPFIVSASIEPLPPGLFLLLLPCFGQC